MSDVALLAERLFKFYGYGKERIDVIKGVHLEIKRGELVSVVGPSGAGKTTLLYLLGGLARPSSGSVSVGGSVISSLSDAEVSGLRNKKLGFVFQAHNLLPELNAQENVALPLRIGGKSGNTSLVAARQLLQEVGLGHRLRSKPGELSGGEQQRVAVARALVTRPDVVLADEPTGNLDGANSDSVFDLLFQTTRSRGQAVVMVTHNDILAKRADRIVRMGDGKIIS